MQNRKHSSLSGEEFCPGKYCMILVDYDNSYMLHLTFSLFFRASHIIAGRTILDAYKRFHNFTTQGTWLTDNVSEVMLLLFYKLCFVY